MIQRLILILVTLAAYANSLRCGLPFDSVVLIRDDIRVQAWTWHNVLAILNQNYWGTRIQGGIYRPVVTFSYLLQHGQPDWAYHAVNLFLHVGCVLLVYALLSRIFRQSPGISFWAALLWAVHPVNTEAVTNVAGRADLLAACCVVGGLLLYSGQRIRLTGLFLVCLVGVFSKEVAVVVLPLALLLDWYERRPVSFVGLSAIVLPIVLMFVVRWRLGLNRGINYAVVDNPLIGADFLTAKLTAFKVLGKLLSVWFWPKVLSADYSYNQIPLVQHTNFWICFLPGVLISLGVLLLAVCFRFGYRWLAFPAAVAISLLTTSNLFFHTGSIMAERFLYLPGIGLAVIVVAAVAKAGTLTRKVRHFRLERAMVAASILLLCSLLGIRTFQRNRDYRDEVSFWIATRDASPDSWKPHAQVAALAAQRGLHQLAAAEADRVIEILKPLPLRDDNYSIWAELFPYYRAINDQAKMHMVADHVALIFNNLPKPVLKP